MKCSKKTIKFVGKKNYKNWHCAEKVVYKFQFTNIETGEVREYQLCTKHMKALYKNFSFKTMDIVKE